MDIKKIGAKKKSVASTTLMILLKARIFMKQIVNNSFDFEEHQGTSYVTYSPNNVKAIIKKVI